MACPRTSGTLASERWNLASVASSPRRAALPPATASVPLSIAVKGSISPDSPLSGPLICFSFLLHFAERAGGEQEQHYAVSGEHGEAALHVLERPARLDELLDHVVGPEQGEG